MKVSIITVCYNSEKYILCNLESVQKQTYDNTEHVIIDGASGDNTLSILKRKVSGKALFISEPDKGIYDAMNKGIKKSTGDIIGTLNSDDFYYSDGIIDEVVSTFKNFDVDIVFGDVVFVNPNNLDKIVRTYSAKNWSPAKFVWGYMPPHPSVFIKKGFFEKLGLYKINYKIASDYELLIRFLKVNKLKYKYIPLKMVKMRLGGASTKNWKSNIILNEEIIKGCRENDLKTNRFMVYSKYVKKVFEYL